MCTVKTCCNSAPYFFSPAPSTAQLTVLQVECWNRKYTCVCVLTHYFHHTHAYILYFNLLVPYRYHVHVQLKI